MSETAIVTEVRTERDGWEVRMDSSVFFVSKSNMDWSTAREVEIKKGDEITLHNGGWGSQITGVDLNGRRLYRKTDREIELERELSLESGDRKKRERFERERPNLDSQYESLPWVFRERIDRRRHNNPNFRHEFESYELFCCTQAIALVECAREATGKDPDWNPEVASNVDREAVDAWIVEWAKLGEREGGYDMKEQRRRFPAFSDGHSGNTYGAMVTLARLYVAAPDRVPDQYGALAPLVGSEAYGDVA